MAGIKLEGGSSTAGSPNVDANYNLNVTLPTVATQAGVAVLATEEDAGVITGTRKVKKLLSCEHGALTVGQYTRLFGDNFPGTALNTGLWMQPGLVTMTVTVANNFLNLNAGLSTAISAVAQVRTYRHFPLDPTNHVVAEIVAQFGQLPVTNNVTEWGVGLATGVAAPTDGLFFRLNAAGNFIAVVCNNSVETVSSPVSFATYVGANTTKEFYIVVSDDNVQFKIGGDLMAEIALPTSGGTLTASQNLPLFARTYNTAATAQAQIMKIGATAVVLDMTNPTKPWPHIICGAGGHASQGQTGGTMGSTALYANSANPTAAVPTNTTAALGVGLGGLFFETDTLAVTTDGIISSFLVPVGTAAVPGKSLYITRITLSSFVQTVLVGGPYVACWSVAYGHNALSLATTEAATTKAPRRMALGIQAVTAAQAVNTLVGSLMDLNFDSPIVVHPGEYVQLVKRKVGTAPTSGAIAHMISIGGYYE